MRDCRSASFLASAIQTLRANARSNAIISDVRRSTPQVFSEIANRISSGHGLRISSHCLNRSALVSALKYKDISRAVFDGIVNRFLGRQFTLIPDFLRKSRPKPAVLGLMKPFGQLHWVSDAYGVGSDETFWTRLTLFCKIPKVQYAQGINGSY